MVTAEEILRKYSRRLNSNTNTYSESQENYSSEYLQFKKDMIPEISGYERWAKSLGSILSLKVAEKDRAKIQRYLNVGHVEVTASQALTLAIMAMLSVFFATMLIVVAAYLISGTAQLLFAFLGLIASMFIFYYAYSMPQRLANAWRLKASSEMVPSILYVVVYMKHTSNLEKAIEFASQHLEGPLALDFKKIIYDVETGKYSTVKHSLDNYLETWRDYSPEYLESFHLVESSLYEPLEARRIEILEKSLQIILDGIYEKMLKYSREIRSPLTNVYMLGIILPTLGLALLPLASTLLQGMIQWQHVFVMFNIIIPFFVFYMTSEVLLKRPGGYGESSILELNPDYYKYKSNKPWMKAAVICIPLLLIGLIPFIFQINFLTDALGINNDYTFGELGISFFADTKMFDFKILEGKTVGPFGPLGALLSLFIPLSVALFFSITYSQKTKDLIKSRDKTKSLEEEFTNSLFQLGNRLADGVPAEIVFSKVAESTQGQTTSNFFSLVNENIQQGGMSLERAVFDEKRGAITYYPSALISTSMRILVESVKKGLAVAARSLMSISEYVKNIHKINQRLRDIMAEIISDMKSNMTFLAPLLAGIVVGLSSMITMILNKLQSIQALTGGGAGAGGFSFASIPQLFNVSMMIPPYFTQVAIGIYIVEIIFILTAALVTVDSGKDTLKEKAELARNLKIGISLYLITALVSILALTILASVALGGMAG
ncbi:MAG: hypothetical protein Q8L29_04290 [archaeon]|nr:hypothetical protein [archaeon]